MDNNMNANSANSNNEGFVEAASTGNPVGQPHPFQDYNQAPPQGTNQVNSQAPPQGNSSNQSYYQASPQGTPYQGYQQPVAGSNVKTFSVLSYIGILWLIGLFSSEKNNPTLRFHVGQGIILTIATVILGIVCSIIISILIGVAGWSYFFNPGLMFLTGIISYSSVIFYIVLAIIGVVNVTKNVQKPLPIIGKMAFFK